jgi:hypothetical protein
MNAANTWHFQGQIIVIGLTKAGELPWWETQPLVVLDSTILICKKVKPMKGKTDAEAGSSLCCGGALLGGLTAWQICYSLYPLS